MRLISAALLVVLAVTPALAQRVSGDAQAWEEVRAALQRLETLRAYRMRTVFAPEMAPQQQMTMLTEVVNPGRRRSVWDLPQGTAETIIVGRQLAYRFVSTTSQPAVPQPSLTVGRLLGAFFDPSGAVFGFLMEVAMNAMMQAALQRLVGWQCRTLEEGAGGVQTAPQIEVEVGRLPDAAVGGVPTRVYRMVWRTADQPPVEQHLYVGADGIPRRMAMVDQGKPLAAMDYQDFDAPITIELPRCT